MRTFGHDSVRAAEAAFERNAKIITDWLNGKTFEAIGEELGLTKQRVHQLAHDVLALHGYRGAKRGHKRILPHLLRLMTQRLEKIREQERPWNI